MIREEYQYTITVAFINDWGQGYVKEFEVIEKSSFPLSVEVVEIKERKNTIQSYMKKKPNGIIESKERMLELRK